MKAGKNSEEEKGRQVTNWLSTTMLGKPGHLAWMKVVGSPRQVADLCRFVWVTDGSLQRD